MHVIMCMHVIPPIWHTHWCEYKKQVRLELNTYFDKLMHMTISTCLEINAYSMHEHVTGLVASRITMHMLSDVFNGWAISVYPDATEARVCFKKMSPLSAQTPSRMTKLGISFPPSTIIRMSKICSHHNGMSVSDVLHGLLKLFCLTWVHVHCNVACCHWVEVQVSIVGCNSHRIDEESWGYMNCHKVECQGPPHPFL